MQKEKLLCLSKLVRIQLKWKNCLSFFQSLWNLLMVIQEERLGILYFCQMLWEDDDLIIILPAIDAHIYEENLDEDFVNVEHFSKEVVEKLEMLKNYCTEKALDSSDEKVLSEKQILLTNLNKNRSKKLCSKKHR